MLTRRLRKENNMPEVEELLSSRMCAKELARVNKDFSKFTNVLQGNSSNRRKRDREARRMSNLKRRTFMHW
jgi:hypothetical protein